MLNPVVSKTGPEKKDIAVGVSQAEFEKFQRLLLKYGMRRKSDFFRTCLEKLFEVDSQGNLQWPLDLARTMSRRPKL